MRIVTRCVAAAVLLLAICGCTKDATGDASAPPQAKPTVKPGPQGKTHVVKTDAKTIASLIKQLSDPKKMSQAVADLSSAGSAAVPSLEQAVKGTDAKVAQLALFALSLTRDKGAFAFINALGDDKAAPLRLTAISRLGATGSPDAIKELARHLADPNAAVRGAAVTGLYFTNSKEGTALLIQALADKEPSVRASAATCLGQLKDPSVKAALERATKDPDAQVSSAAKTALANLTRR